MTYPQWTPQQVETQPWKQGWRGPMYGNPSYPTYPQYPANISQLLPRFNPPQIQDLFPPPIQQQFTTPLNPNQQQQPPINANQHQNQAAHNPLKPTTIPNPNNRTTHLVKNKEVQTFPTYEIQLRSGKVVNQSNPAVIIKEENDNHSEE
jgi:hypothetical protein